MTTGEFTEELKRTIEERRTFGRHPLWQRIAEGGLSRDESLYAEETERISGVNAIARKGS